MDNTHKIMYKEINRLIDSYSIAWEFCGNNTKAKIKLAKQLAKKLNNEVKKLSRSDRKFA